MNPNGTLWSRADFSPGVLIVPSDMTPGFTVSNTFTVSVNGSTGSNGATGSVTVNGVESVTVPAGTFSATKYTSLSYLTTVSKDGTVSRGTVPSTEVQWQAAGVGMVRQTVVANTVTGQTDELVLTSFHIP